MKTGSDYKKFFQELEKWSQKKSSYSIDDFLKEKNVSDQQLGDRASGRSSFYLAIGNAVCQCLENAYKAWKSKEISRDQFSTYLIQSGLFRCDVETFDRLRQKFEQRSAGKNIELRADQEISKLTSNNR